MIKVSDLPEELFIQLAIGVDTFENICDNFGISAQDAQVLEVDPEFVRRMRIATQSVEDDGRAFRTRCRTAVNGTIHRVMNMIADPNVPATVQLDAFKTLAKFGDLEPVRQQASQGPTGPQLVLNILPPNTTMPQNDMNVIDVTDFMEVVHMSPDESARFGAS